MNRYGTFSRGGPSKATASTLCQKCLKKDIYECKAVAQERPYVSRPSRTQQLLNPKLLPKLTSDVPQDLLRKKGIADEQLAKIDKERVLNLEQPDDIAEPSIMKSYSKSTSSSSSASVATISTNASGSQQMSRGRETELDHRLSSSKSPMATSERKRRRSVSSDGSFPSDLELRRESEMTSTRSTRRKIGEHSPLMRGRRRSRTVSRSRHTAYSSNSRSPERGRHGRVSGRNPNLDVGRNTIPYDADPKSRSGHRDRSNADRKRPAFRDDGNSPSRKSRHKRTRSPDINEGRREVANPSSMRRPRDRTFNGDNLDRQRYSNVDERYGASSKSNDQFSGPVSHERGPVGAPQRERSLSPFSKRSALTQAMKTGR